MTKFMKRVGSDYVETSSRPSDAEKRSLQKQITKLSDRSNLHTPGMGWHNVPGEPMVLCNDEGQHWFVLMPASEGAIFAYVEAYCISVGIDYKSLVQKAYPEEDFIPVTEEDRKYMARPLKADDLPAILDDLTEINWHSLCSDLKEIADGGGATV